MAVDLAKIESEAPHLTDLYKETQGLVLSKGLDPKIYKSSVVGTFDLSGSTEMGKNRLYTGGDRIMQGVGNIAVAAGFVFDDDGEVPVSFFHSKVIDLGVVTPATSRDFLDQFRRYDFGGTNYLKALQWIVKQAGFEHVDLGDLHAWARAIRTGDFSKVRPLEVKATAKYPTYAIFATDGEPQDDQYMIMAYLYLMSQLPIFLSCIGVGANTEFPMLETFNNLPTQPEDPHGRLIDNVGAFDSKKAGGNQSEMLRLMLGEYPRYYSNARNLDQVTV